MAMENPLWMEVSIRKSPIIIGGYMLFYVSQIGSYISSCCKWVWYSRVPFRGIPGLLLQPSRIWFLWKPPWSVDSAPWETIVESLCLYLAELPWGKGNVVTGTFWGMWKSFSWPHRWMSAPGQSDAWQVRVGWIWSPFFCATFSATTSHT